MTTAILHDVAPPRFDPKLIQMVRETIPNIIAKEILSVQPMDPALGKQLMEGGMSEAQLRAEGYEPVSCHGVLWMKKA